MGTSADISEFIKGFDTFAVWELVWDNFQIFKHMFCQEPQSLTRKEEFDIYCQYVRSEEKSNHSMSKRKNHLCLGDFSLRYKRFVQMIIFSKVCFCLDSGPIALFVLLPMHPSVYYVDREQWKLSSWVFSVLCCGYIPIDFHVIGYRSSTCQFLLSCEKRQFWNFMLICK